MGRARRAAAFGRGLLPDEAWDSSSDEECHPAFRGHLPNVTYWRQRKSGLSPPDGMLVKHLVFDTDSSSGSAPSSPRSAGPRPELAGPEAGLAQGAHGGRDADGLSTELCASEGCPGLDTPVPEQPPRRKPRVRPGKGKRDRYQRFARRVIERLEQDPKNFKVEDIDLPESVATNDFLRQKFLKRVEAKLKSCEEQSFQAETSGSTER